MTFEEALKKLKSDQRRSQYLRSSIGDFIAGNVSEEELKRRIYEGPPPADQNPVPPKKAPNWGSVDEMMRDLAKLPKTPAKPKIDKPTRITQIEKELDIIRGRVPTPAGYKVDAGKVKGLMTELRQLRSTP